VLARGAEINPGEPAMSTQVPLSVGAILAALVLLPAAKADTIPLPDADRTALQVLGSGVVGDPVAASPLAAADIPLKAGTWTYQLVAGNNAGATQDYVLTQLERDPSGASWKLQRGQNDTMFLKLGDDQAVAIIAEQDTDEGVITRFSPAEPLLTTGMNPGDSKKVTIDVKVYDLSSPDEVSHSGSLDLEYSYIGAYKVTVPAGSYDAALLRWVYDGSVGPASVKDTQYRFVAEDVGIVASIDKKKISAMLLYHDDSNTVRVLQKAP
jgi:hypothetical protein